MGKVLCFIYNDMADFELTLACQFLKYANVHEIVPIGYEIETIKSRPGLLYIPSATVKEALQYSDIEGLIIPGGWNDEQRPELTELIQKIHGSGKLVAAICAGPQYLARAGILKQHTYTTTLTPEHFKQLEKEDFFPRENYVNEKVVRDKNVITALGNCFVDFAMEIGDYFGMFNENDPKEESANYFKGLL